MAIDYDVTEGLPYPLSNPISSVSYTPTTEDYDISFGTLPFFLASSDEFPYRRQTAPYRKQQIDQSNEPGEQSLSNWWLRSQSSFHRGAGIVYYDPSAGEAVPYRFTDSRGVDVWTKGKFTLLNDVTSVHATTGQIRSNGRHFQELRSVRYSNTDAVLLKDEYDVDKITPAGVTHFIDYNAGGDDPVFAICDDGTFAYWVTNDTASGKLEVNKKTLTGDSTTADIVLFTEPGITVTNAVMEFVKERIVMCANNRVYEFPTSATSLPSPVYTHPSTDYVFTSITASGPAIYIAGYNGIKSVIHKFTLSTAGAMPTLTSAITAAEMPLGEIIHKIYYYLGYMMIGTNKGVRAAIVNDQDGSINYGPLIVETSQPVYDFTARDRFVWCTAKVGTSPGTIRINLGEEIETLRFAYANDIYEPDVTNGAQSTGVAFLGNTSRVVFCSNAISASVSGSIYIQSDTNYLTSGYLQTGYIRYATIEDKVFKTINVNVDNTHGGIQVQSVSKSGNEYTIATFGEDDVIEEISVSFPQGTQEFVAFKFILTVDAFHPATPVFFAYQLKSLPAIARQRLIQYPVLCYDNEADKFGNQIGYDGYAFSRLQAIEALESLGDTIRVKDFRNNETFLGVIEELNFVNRTPPSPTFSGFGGLLLVTIRSVG